MVKRRGIVIVDLISLKRLASGEYFDLLLKLDAPIFVSDMAMHEAGDDPQVRTFAQKHAGNLLEIQTGVPAIAKKLSELGVNAGEEAIRRIVDHCNPEDVAGCQYALIMDDEHFMLAGVSDQSFVLSLRTFMPQVDGQAVAAKVAEVPGILGGRRPVVVGTRVPADNVMAEVSDGTALFDIFASYPSLPLDGVDACIQWDRMGRS